MKPPETLTATVNCPSCPGPVQITIPVQIHGTRTPPTLHIAVDEDALRQAVRVHALQHQDA